MPAITIQTTVTHSIYWYKPAGKLLDDVWRAINLFDMQQVEDVFLDRETGTVYIGFPLDNSVYRDEAVLLMGMIYGNVEINVDTIDLLKYAIVRLEPIEILATLTGLPPLNLKNRLCFANIHLDPLQMLRDRIRPAVEKALANYVDRLPKVVAKVNVGHIKASVSIRVVERIRFDSLEEAEEKTRLYAKYLERVLREVGRNVAREIFLAAVDAVKEYYLKAYNILF